MVKLLLSFFAGLALGYLRRRLIEAVALCVLFAFLLSAMSVIPYRYERYGDIQYLLPLSYPLHAETQRFIVLMIMPPPPNIKLTLYFIDAPITALWFHTIFDAYFTSFATFLVADFATMIVATFLGRLIHGRFHTFPERHKLHPQ